MPRENVNDLLAFLAVARERSFTRAAARLGVSQSALSHTIRGLEARLGLRLLTRTTRSVAPTEAGERLLRNVGPRFEEIETELDALSELRDKPAGTIRITTGEHAADTILWPALAKLLPKYPDIKVEINVELRPDRHRDRALRRRHAVRRAGGEGHDRRAHRAGHAHGRGRVLRPISRSGQCRSAAGSDRRTIASTSVCRPMAGSMPGNSRRTAAN